jgi:hypothetical protein
MPDLDGFKAKVRTVASPNEIRSNRLLEPIPLTLSFEFEGLAANLPFRAAPGLKHVHVFTPDDNRFKPTPLNLLPVFLQASGMRGQWKDASFAQSFTELNAQMTDISDKKFKDALTYLKWQSSVLKPKPDETVDVFGAKLNAAEISKWGMVLILGFQFYLLILFFELARVFRSPGPDLLSWSGLFPDWIARSFTLVSCALLPFALLLYLAYFEFRKWPDTLTIRILYPSFAVAVSLVLSLCAILKLRKVWR